MFEDKTDLIPVITVALVIGLIALGQVVVLL